MTAKFNVYEKGVQKMDNSILTLEQACDFLGVSERTLIKLLREEHIPARKIGREWRFSKDSLIEWISSGDSYAYSSQDDSFAVYEDEEGNCKDLMNDICKEIATINDSNDIKTVITGLDRSISIPDDIKLSISYKQKRDIEKLEFKLYWPLRDEVKINAKSKDA